MDFENTFEVKATVGDATFFEVTPGDLVQVQVEFS